MQTIAKHYYTGFLAGCGSTNPSPNGVYKTHKGTPHSASHRGMWCPPRACAHSRRSQTHARSPNAMHSCTHSIPRDPSRSWTRRRPSRGTRRSPGVQSTSNSTGKARQITTTVRGIAPARPKQAFPILSASLRCRYTAPVRGAEMKAWDRSKIGSFQNTIATTRLRSSNLTRLPSPDKTLRQ